jgi:excisionase family DNA binding protein
LRVRDVAERLEVSLSLVYVLIASGKLRCTRHGAGRGTVRISEEQLAEYLAAVEGPKTVRSRSAENAGAFKHLDAAKLRQAWRQG